MAKFRIGTSGYNFKEWRGSFYPPEVDESAMLRFYAERFNSVEMNYTFYRLPNVRTLQGWAKETPPDFLFSVKAPRRITHDLRLRDAGDAVTYFCDTAKALKSHLGAMLFQLPPFLKKDLPRLEDFLHQLPPGFRPVFEFRNASWLADDVFECLRRFDVAVCIGENDERCTPFEVTAGFGYFRLRKSQYSDAEIATWADRIAAAPWDEAYVYFKQEVDGLAPTYAGKLAALLNPGADTVATAESA